MTTRCLLAGALLLGGARPALAQVPAQASIQLPVRLDSVAHARPVAAFQQHLNQEFKSPQESPLSADEWQAFSTLPYYPAGYRYYVVGRLVRDSTAQLFPMVTSTARRPLYRKYDDVFFTLAGRQLKLSVYQSPDLMARPGLADYLLLPFTDLTNGHGSYGGGRYLDLTIPPPAVPRCCSTSTAPTTPRAPTVPSTPAPCRRPRTTCPSPFRPG